ncbi:S41 family peptidase [Winogradskyella flava]|uniref:S41 family peptidase n=1 Tax=Winogradskyella flava TaxID=1884876 RepID=UPI00248F7BB1|nr:S41 family peptidase [Winogradskyella flava]
MLRFRKVLIILFVLQSVLSYSQKILSKKEKYKVIDRIKELIDTQYVLANKTEIINNSLDSLKSTKKYKNIKDYRNFAEALSEDLVTISKDQHFKIQYNPELVSSRREERKRWQELEQIGEAENQKEVFDINYWYSQKINFGIQKVEILEGNIGYMKLTFFDILQWAQSTIDAAMGVLANTDALIIDIRDNGGGYISASYLASYFFDEKPTVWNIGYERPSSLRDTTYTYREIGGQRYLKKPIYILVNKKSFSRAELFAYCMKHHNKAIIVGQTTAGASHGIDFLEMDDNFLIQLPITSSIHPVTKTDWEGIGVIPHIKTTKEETLKVAYTMILDELIASEKDQELGRHYDRLKKKYKGIKEKTTN